MRISNRREISIPERRGHHAAAKSRTTGQRQPGRAAVHPEARGPQVLAVPPAEGGRLVTSGVLEEWLEGLLLSRGRTD